MDAATTELLKLGLPGIVIFGLAWAVVSLYRGRTADTVTYTNTVAALQEARLADVRKQTEAFVNAATSMNNMRDMIEQLDGSLRTMIAEFQARQRR